MTPPDEEGIPMAHDPVVADTVRASDSREPRFVLPEQESRAAASLDAYR